jgi:hypothetical protein
MNRAARYPTVTGSCPHPQAGPSSRAGSVAPGRLEKPYHFPTSRQLLAFAVRAQQLVDEAAAEAGVRVTFGCAQVSLRHAGGADGLSALVEALDQAAAAIRRPCLPAGPLSPRVRGRTRTG